MIDIVQCVSCQQSFPHQKEKIFIIDSQFYCKNCSKRYTENQYLIDKMRCQLENIKEGKIYG